MKRFIIRAGKALPPKARKRFEKLGTPLTGKLSRRGVSARPETIKWIQTNKKSVSIVIPSYNDFSLLRACIKSIRKTVSRFDYEIIVVDDFCQPQNTEKLLTLEAEDCKVIHKESRQGFAVTVNVGMAAANKEDIVLLNSDTVALSGWLDELQFSAYAIDPLIGLVSPKLLYPSGRIQYGGTFHARDIAPQWFAHLNAGKWATHPDGNVEGYIFGISGACMYTTRDTYSRLGGLDENYWLGFEDVDYAMAAWTQHIRCFYQPHSVLVHHESASRGYSQGKRELGSLRYFWKKWEILFSKKSLSETKSITFISNSEAISEGWSNHIKFLANVANQSGFIVETINSASEKFENFLSTADSYKGILISTDDFSSEEVWLSSISTKPAIRLIQERELEQANKDAILKARLKPEFYFVTATEAQAHQLNSITPWKSKEVVYPISSFSNRYISTGGSRKVLVLTDPGIAIQSQFSSEAQVEVKEVTHITNELCEHIVAEKYGVILNLRAGLDAEEFFQLSTCGAALVSWKSNGLELIALDGYNCLLVQPGDNNQAFERANDIIGDELVKEELTSNAWKIYEDAQKLSQDNFLAVLNALVRVE